MSDGKRGRDDEIANFYFLIPRAFLTETTREGYEALCGG
jgi:hypothetical protein